MNIVESKSWTLGAYTILQRARFDSPSWAVYMIYKGKRFIGKQFSCPCESDCTWHESQQGVYAQRDTERVSYGYSAKVVERRGRKTNAERARLAALKDEEAVS